MSQLGSGGLGPAPAFQSRPIIADSAFRAARSFVAGENLLPEDEMAAKRLLNTGIERLSTASNYDATARPLYSAMISKSTLPETTSIREKAFERILNPLDPLWSSRQSDK